MRSRLTAAWDRFWFAQVPTSTFALFRIAFGVLTFTWALSLAPSVFAFYSDSGVLPIRPDYNSNFDWSVFDLVSTDLMVAVMYFLLYVAALMLIVGWRSRLAAFVVFVCLISFGRRNPWVLN